MKAAALALDTNCVKSVEITLRPGLASFKGCGSTTSADTSTSECTMPKGEGLVIRMNPDLFADSINCLTDDDFRLEYDDGTRPIVVKCSLPWMAVIMPQRIK